MKRRLLQNGPQYMTAAQTAQYLRQAEGAKRWEEEYWKIVLDMGLSAFTLQDSICFPAGMPMEVIEEFERRVKEIKL